jgi:hypothetical protein
VASAGTDAEAWTSGNVSGTGRKGDRQEKFQEPILDRRRRSAKMAIVVVCSKCQKQHNAPDSLAGRACRCKCGNVIQVPVPQQQPPANLGSLFDELSQGDIDRKQNVAKQPVADSSPPFHSYCLPTPAKSSLSSPTTCELSRRSLKSALLLSAIWMLLVLGLGFFYVLSVYEKVKADPTMTRDRSLAISTSTGKQIGNIAGFGLFGIWGAWLLLRKADKYFDAS